MKEVLHTGSDTGLGERVISYAMRKYKLIN